MSWDRARIYVRAGTGGSGAVAFRREKHVPRGGPSGGDGGRGGDVILKAETGLNTLLPFHNKVHYRAAHGKHGSSSHRHGAAGADVVLTVPIGTVVAREQGQILADLSQEGQQVVVARGGRGGRGNARFKGPRRTAPRIAENGEPGEEFWLALDLKLLADVGLVGAPNAGKSSLLARCTAARPQVADYPFTTLKPHLGVVSLDDERVMVLADLPGLLEGAHQGVGLGHEFLRHAERTRVLVQVVDLSAPDPWLDFETVEAEVAAYGEGMSRRPRLVAANKVDLPAAREAWGQLEQRWQQRGLQAFPVSAATGEGVHELMAATHRTLADAPHPTAAHDDMPQAVFGPPEEPFSVHRDGRVWVVTGSTVERWVAMTPRDNKEAVRHTLARMRRMGVENALQSAGAAEGDTVRVGHMEFEFRAEGGA